MNDNCSHYTAFPFLFQELFQNARKHSKKRQNRTSFVTYYKHPVFFIFFKKSLDKDFNL